MVTNDGQVRVMDFGLARLLDLPASDEVAIRGTPGFMAPEQAAGRQREIGVWTDVYGLGAVLYHLITGRAPFTVRQLRIAPFISRRTIPESPAATTSESLTKVPTGARRREARERSKNTKSPAAAGLKSTGCFPPLRT